MWISLWQSLKSYMFLFVMFQLGHSVNFTVASQVAEEMHLVYEGRSKVRSLTQL